MTVALVQQHSKTIHKETENAKKSTSFDSNTYNMSVNHKAWLILSNLFMLAKVL